MDKSEVTTGKMQSDVGKLEAQLRQCGVKIDELVAKGGKLGSNANSDRARGIDDLKSKQKAAQGKLSALKDAGDAKWETHKPGVDSALTELESAIAKMSKN